MKNIKTLMLGLLMAVSLTTTAAYAQTSTSSATPSSQSNNTVISKDKKETKNIQEKVQFTLPEVDVENIIKDNKVLKPEVFIVLVLSMIAGGCGGFIFELLNLQGNVEKPHKPTDDELAAKFAYALPKHVVDLGVRARILIGTFAAPPAILFLRPESAFGFIAMSIVAGSAGTAVFRALQDRLLVAVAHKEKEDKEEQSKNMSQVIEVLNKTKADLDINNPEKAKENIESAIALCHSMITSEKSNKAGEQTKLQDKVDEAIEAFQNLKYKLIKASTSPENETKLKFMGGGGIFSFFSGASLEQEDLNKIVNILSEIKGLSSTIATLNDSINQNITQVDQAIQAFETLKENIIKSSIRPGGKSTLEFTDGAFMEQKDLDYLEKLLSELKGSLSIERKTSLVA